MEHVGTTTNGDHLVAMTDSEFTALVALREAHDNRDYGYYRSLNIREETISHHPQLDWYNAFETIKSWSIMRMRISQLEQLVKGLSEVIPPLLIENPNDDKSDPA